MISTAVTIARKEFASLFYSPIAYGVATIFFLLNGYHFYEYLTYPGINGDLKQAVSLLYGGWIVYWFVVLLVPPLLTMRLFAEEKRSGTIEVLMTAPVTDLAVVLGKFAAAFGYYVFLWLPSLLYLALVAALGGNPDFGLAASGFLVTLLSGALFLAIGLFFSATTSNQILAAVGALVVNLLLFLLSFYGASLAREKMRDLLERYSLLNIYFTRFLNGMVDTADLVYFASLTALFLFLTVRVVEARKWR